MVGLGETAKELETKWNTKLDRVYPEFTKRSQKLAELEPEFERLKAEVTKAKETPETEEYTPEQKEKARKALFELMGGEPLVKNQFDEYYMQRRSGELLLEDTRRVVAEAESLGKPKASVESLLEHMRETGIKNPERAYKDMFDAELDKWKEEQIKKAKPSGFTTQSTTTAGSKQPPTVRPTKHNLDQLLTEALGL